MDVYELSERVTKDLASLSNQVFEMNNKLNQLLDMRVDEITPYTATQTAYYGESEKVFYNVPQGNITVFWDNYNGDYAVERIADRIVVSFDALTDNATISIMIQ